MCKVGQGNYVFSIKFYKLFNISIKFQSLFYIVQSCQKISIVDRKLLNLVSALSGSSWLQSPTTRKQRVHTLKTPRLPICQGSRLHQRTRFQKVVIRLTRHKRFSFLNWLRNVLRKNLQYPFWICLCDI